MRVHQITSVEPKVVFKQAEHLKEQVPLKVFDIITPLFFLFGIVYFVAGFFINWKDVF